MAGMPQDDWEPGRWWRVIDPAGSVWCETSDEQEARKAVRPGDTLLRMWQRTAREWRAVQQESGGMPCSTA